MQLTETERDTLAVLRQALNPETALPELTAKWADIEKELTDQTVAFLPSVTVAGFGATIEDVKRLQGERAKNVQNFYRILRDQEDLEKVLEGIPFIVLKGTAAAMYYPKPVYRKMGDIDILVLPGDMDRATKAMEQAGYEKEKEDDTRHVGFVSARGLLIELHHKFSSSDNEAQNEILDRIVYEAMERREYWEIFGKKVPVLPKPENGLVLLGHINQHLSGGLGLRQIVDWMLYVRECLDDDFWKESFCGAAEAIGMRKLAETTTLLCKKYLGLEGVTWCDKADEKLADELLGYIFLKGNFGNKVEEGSNATVSTFHKVSSPAALFRYLTQCGVYLWPASRENRFLRLFAWIVGGFYLVKKGLQRRIRVSDLLKEARQSKRETEMLKDLGVTRK